MFRAFLKTFPVILVRQLQFVLHSEPGIIGSATGSSDGSGDGDGSDVFVTIGALDVFSSADVGSTTEVDVTSSVSVGVATGPVKNYTK